MAGETIVGGPTPLGVGYDRLLLFFDTTRRRAGHTAVGGTGMSGGAMPGITGVSGAAMPGAGQDKCGKCHSGCKNGDSECEQKCDRLCGDGMPGITGAGMSGTAVTTGTTAVGVGVGVSDTDVLCIHTALANLMQVAVLSNLSKPVNIDL